MKIRELVAELQKYDPETEIYCNDADFGGYDYETQPVTHVGTMEFYGEDKVREVLTIQGSYAEREV